nr:ATP-binding protein [Bacteroidota bacterium]
MDIIKQIILENQDFIASRNLIAREVNIPKTDNIIIFTGIRRSGKTSFLYLEARKIPIEKVLYLDFEDERLTFINSLPNYEVILESYCELYPDTQPILFLDEVQSLDSWHLFVKRLHAKGFKVFISGSNADLLSREIATYVSGRGIEIFVHPFSFNEFLKFKNIDHSIKSRLTKKALLKSAFNEYLTYGGFPEVVKAEQNDKRIIIKNIFSLIFYKDLIAKQNRNETLMRLIIQKVNENVGKAFSLSNMANKINPVYSTNRQTVHEYYQLLHLPYLIDDMVQYRKSILKRESERKAYFADNALISNLSVGQDYGKLLENMVYNSLFQTREEVFYYKTSNSLEVDFLTEKSGKNELFQVSYDISNSTTFEREIKALQKAMKETGLKESILLTADQKQTIETNGHKINILPCWEWLLDNEQ